MLFPSEICDSRKFASGRRAWMVWRTMRHMPPTTPQPKKRQQRLTKGTILTSMHRGDSNLRLAFPYTALRILLQQKNLCRANARGGTDEDCFVCQGLRRGGRCHRIFPRRSGSASENPPRHSQTVLRLQDVCQARTVLLQHHPAMGASYTGTALSTEAIGLLTNRITPKHCLC